MTRDELGIVIRGFAPTLKRFEARLTALEGVSALIPRKDYSEDVSALRERVALLEAAPDAIGREVDPLREIIKALEERTASHELERLVSDQVARIPIPKDGKDADVSVIAALKAEIAALRAEVATQKPAPASVAVAELLATITSVVSEQVAALPRALPGKDADPALVDASVAKAVAAIPVPRDGRDGASLDDIRAMVVTQVAVAVGGVPAEIEKAVALLPRPKDGKDGTSVERTDVEGMVAKAVSAIPRPKDGEDGRDLSSADVAPMIAAEVAKAVSAIPLARDGKDGVWVSGAIVDRAGRLLLTLSDGAVKDAGVVVGEDADPAEMRRLIADEVAKIPRPKDGLDGLDGLGFDDFDVLHDGERTVTLRWSRGDQVKEKAVVFPTTIYRGVWLDGKTYAVGDEVTWASSMWVARSQTDAKPGDGATAWQLACKAGRDGKPGKGEPGKPGMDGRPGKDLTQVDQSGRKW